MVSPQNGDTWGGLPPPPPHSDATAQIITSNMDATSLLKELLSS